MANYKLQYKCRMCGEVFTASMTSNETIAMSTICQIAAGHQKGVNAGIVVNTFMTHMEEDHYGIADLIGFEIRREEANGLNINPESEDKQERKSFDGLIVGDEIVGDDGIYRVTDIDGYAGYESVRIMTKEAFIEAYNKFIVNDESEDENDNNT